MDKRIEATLERVYHAYFKEKKKKSISEIKVIDICKWAEINKTTFYRHFRDIYDLADWAENQLIEEMISHYQHMDQLLSHPEIYIEENMAISQQYEEPLETLFDQRKYLMISKIEEALVRKCEIENRTSYETHLIRFCIGGASHIITGKQSKEEMEVSNQFLVNILKKLV